MRSYDRRMPEELNRVLTDHAASLLLCSSAAAAETLRGERVVGEVVTVGDVMVDVFELLAPRADASMLERLGRRARRVSARPPRIAPATSTTRRGCGRWSMS